MTRFSFNIDQQPLADAIGFLQATTGLNIVLDPKALSEAGLTSSSPVTLRLKQVTLRTALKLLLNPLGLTYKLEDEVVLITGPEAGAMGAKVRYPRTYYVGDLLIKPSTQKQTGTTPAEGVQSKIDMMPLMELIEFSVARGTWQVQDGYGHVVPSKKSTRAAIPEEQRNIMVPFHLSLSLIIKSSEDVHDDVADFLRCLRRLQGPRGDREAEGTNVASKPDIDILVSESKRVIGVSDTTMFEIRLANYGNKPATNLQLTANLSPNLEVVSAAAMQNDVNVLTDQSKRMLKFSQIAKMEPGTVMVFGFRVKATGEAPRLATCKAIVSHDDLPDGTEDMAGVKVKTRVPAALESFDRNIR